MERSPASLAGPRPRRARLLAAFALVAVAIIGLLGSAALGPAGAQTSATEEFFDFEDLDARISGSPATPPVEREYADRGVIFPTGVTALIFDETSFPPRPDLPRSPSQVITTCYSQEFCSTRINLAFDPPVERVDLHVGYAQRLLQPAGVVLEAFDATGASLGATRVTLGASDVAIPADTLLSIADPSGRIVAAQVRLADEDRGLSSLIVDDLTIAPFVAVSQAEVDPELIQLDLTDEAVSTRLQLINTGNQTLTDLSVEVLEADGDVIDVTASPGAACGPALAPGARCPVTLELRPTGSGVVDGVLLVVADGQEVAEAGLSVVVSPTPDTTAPPDDTGSTTDSVTTDGDGDGDGAGAADDDAGGFPPWLVYLLGGAILGVGGRRAWKGRQPAAPGPPAPEPTTQPSGSPSPEVTVQPDVGRASIDVDGDRALVASLGLATAVLTIDSHNDEDGDENEDQDDDDSDEPEGSGP